jgi:hypothetical protein
MHERREAGSPGRHAAGFTGPAAARSRAPRTAALLGVLLLVGCNADGRKKASPADPLFGPPSAAATLGPAAAPQPVNPVNPVNPLAPPQPAVSASPSPASLAGGSPPRYDTEDHLRIPGQTVARAPAGGWQGQDTGSPVQLRGPDGQPVSGPSFAPPVAGSRIGSYEQAQEQLARRGVTWQRLESWGDRGEWQFSCSVPNRQNKFISRTYEARGKDYLSAVRAVLDQIDKEQ